MSDQEATPGVVAPRLSLLVLCNAGFILIYIFTMRNTKKEKSHQDGYHVRISSNFQTTFLGQSKLRERMGIAFIAGAIYIFPLNSHNLVRQILFLFHNKEMTIFKSRFG